MHAAAVELQVVVTSEHVGEEPQALRDLLPADGLLLRDLKDVRRILD